VYALPKEDFALEPGNRDQVNVLCGFVAFINDILESQPLVQKPKADVSISSPAALQHRLPTPAPGVWRQLETIVLRALVLLNWVVLSIVSSPSQQSELDKWAFLFDELDHLSSSASSSSGHAIGHGTSVQGRTACRLAISVYAQELQRIPLQCDNCHVATTCSGRKVGEEARGCRQIHLLCSTRGFLCVRNHLHDAR